MKINGELIEKIVAEIKANEDEIIEKVKDDDSYCPDFYEGLSLCGHKVGDYSEIVPRTPLL